LANPVNYFFHDSLLPGVDMNAGYGWGGSMNVDARMKHFKRA